MSWRAWLVGVLTLTAQGQDLRPAFEAASVKVTDINAVMAAKRQGAPTLGLGGGPGTNQPGKFTGDPATLRSLIQRAYGIQPYQLSGPAWMVSQLYEIAAIVPEGATKADLALMLQRLLEERFKLAIHREQKELAVYEMTVAKAGRAFAESVERDAEPPPSPLSSPFDKDGYPIIPPGATYTTATHGVRTTWSKSHTSMDQLAEQLTGMLGRPVVDATGLTRSYAITFHYISDPAGVNGGTPKETTPEAGPTLAAAVQSQLGLKLESKKALVDVFVVDHLEKVPTGN
jgi:uncharacterized protein (TIGR03435 family)